MPLSGATSVLENVVVWLIWFVSLCLFEDLEPLLHWLELRASTLRKIWRRGSGDAKAFHLRSLQYDKAALANSEWKSVREGLSKFDMNMLRHHFKINSQHPSILLNFPSGCFLINGSSLGIRLCLAKGRRRQKSCRYKNLWNSRIRNSSPHH